MIASDIPDWSRIESFVGFGRRDAPVMFVGMEEGLNDANALAEDLAIRSTYASPVMDLREAFRGVVDADRYFDPERAPRQPTWRVMADLMLRRSGINNPNARDRRRYRALELGRTVGDTLLTELLPYPHPKSRDWLYSEFGRFATRADYEAQVLPSRKRLLRSVIDEARRELIVCYGKANWSHYEDLFDGTTWSEAEPYRIGLRGDTRIVLASHFSGHEFNTDAQLEALGKIALGSYRTCSP